jgi:hypothetical protein
MEEEENTFTLDNVVHEIDNVSEGARYLVFSLNDLNEKRKRLQQKVAILNAAELSFVQQLRKEVEETEDQPEEVKEGEVV